MSVDLAALAERLVLLHGEQTPRMALEHISFKDSLAILGMGISLYELTWLNGESAGSRSHYPQSRAGHPEP